MTLYGIDLTCYRDVIGSINKIHTQQTLSDCLQKIVDEISSNLKMVGVAIFLIEGGELTFKTTSKGTYREKMFNLFGDEIKMIRFNIDDSQPNPQIRAILSKQLVLSNSFYECVKPHLNRAVADFILKLVGIEVIGFLPIIHDTPNGEKAIGVIGFAVKKSHIVEEVLPLMYGYLDSAAIAISRFQKSG